MQVSCLDQFQTWCYWKKFEVENQQYIEKKFPIDDIGFGNVIDQNELFLDDQHRHIHNLIKHTKYEVLAVTQRIATCVIAPFALFVDFYRLCVTKEIDIKTWVKDFYLIPKHILTSIFYLVIDAIRIADKIVNAISIEVGHLAWHTGEWLVRKIKSYSNKENTPEKLTVLSQRSDYRDIVYSSIGITMIAAAIMFIPILPIQIIALPIILGSLYGTLNNQFTVRDCPEYYTMGHYYDGTNLAGHAIRTNNLAIKPIVTGCYATTMVTKIAGVILAAVGVLPFTAAVLPITIAVGMVGAVLLIGLITGHIFATMKKNKINKSLEEYVKLIDVKLTEEKKSMTWSMFNQECIKDIEAKRLALKDSKDDLNNFNKKIKSLEDYLSQNSFEYVPIKYMAGWAMNNARNGTGYIFAGAGTLAFTVTTVFLRIFLL